MGNMEQSVLLQAGSNYAWSHLTPPGRLSELKPQYESRADSLERMTNIAPYNVVMVPKVLSKILPV